MVWIVGIIAFVIGLLLGWWLADGACRRKFQAAEADWNAKLAAAQQATADASAKAAAARADAQTARGEADTAKAEAEAARSAAEAANADAERARSAAEAALTAEATARTEAETSKAEAETARAESAQVRSAAEAAEVRLVSAKAEAETARADAEAARGEAAAAADHRATESFAAIPAAGLAPASPEPDDLTKIEGIGPKYAELLNDGGITTFAALAAAPRERLQSILDGGGPRYQMHDPTSWPAQADLAAAGRWDDLSELQDRLSGGRAD